MREEMEVQVQAVVVAMVVPSLASQCSAVW
jgi:hypothetical protein